MNCRRAAAKEKTQEAALYVRVSTDDQATNGVSLAMQEERLRAYCKSRGWAVHRAYRDDGASGKSLDRPALRALLDDAKAGRFSAVCVFKLDRLTRNLSDLLALVKLFGKRALALVSLSESFDATTATGRAFLSMMGTFAELERETIGERIAAALRHKRDHRQVYGAVPYGFKRSGNRLQPAERELEVVRRIYRLHRRGKTLAAIAGALNGERVPTKRGRKWAPATVHYILRNGLYAPYLKGVRRG